MLEKVIEYEILNCLKGCGIFCWKVDRTGVYDAKRKVFRSNNNPHKIKGVSDILAVIEGRTIAIEVKSQKGSLSDEQRVFLAQVNANGGVAFVARSAIQAANELVKHFPMHVKLRAFISQNSLLN